MTPEEYKWNIEIIQGRYGISLTFEQAERVYLFEREKDGDSAGQYFSYWEEHEYEMDSFAKILNSSQFDEFKTARLKSLKELEDGIVESDKEQVYQINYHKEILDYLSNNFLPDFFKEKFLFITLSLPEFKAKVDYLKTEYKRFLEITNKETLISHYRYYRCFQPNLLEVSRLQNKINHVNPDYHSFYHKLDESAKGIADFFNKNQKIIHETQMVFLNRKHKELYDFYERLNEKYFNPIPTCSYIKYGLAEERPIDSWTMTLVLIDKGKYGG